MEDGSISREEPRVVAQTVGLKGAGFSLQPVLLAPRPARPHGVESDPAERVFGKFGSAGSESGDRLARQEFPPLWACPAE